MRISVSSEAYGKFNAKKEFKVKVVQKTSETIKRIKEKLS